eukprot:364876-Chlamydomonas_euryale.AAC.8
MHEAFLTYRPVCEGIHTPHPETPNQHPSTSEPLIGQMCGTEAKRLHPAGPPHPFPPHPPTEQPAAPHNTHQASRWTRPMCIHPRRNAT